MSPDEVAPDPAEHESEAQGATASASTDACPAVVEAVPWWRSQPFRLVVALAILGVVVAAVLQVPGAIDDFSTAIGRINPSRLPWLLAAIAFELASLVCFGLAQHQVFVSRRPQMGVRTLLRLSIAANGLGAVLPAGPVPANSWLISQYRRIEPSRCLGIFVVLVAAFASTTTVLILLVVGALFAGIASGFVLALCLAAVVGGSAVVVTVARRLALRLPGSEHFDDPFRALERALGTKVGLSTGARVYAMSLANWLFDAACLASAFPLMGLGVPWRGLLFAHAAAQVAGGAIPLPGGLGAVEGGAIGGFVLAGVHPGEAVAAVLAYRLVSYWGVAGFGAAQLYGLARRPVGHPALAHGTSTAKPTFVSVLSDVRRGILPGGGALFSRSAPTASRVEPGTGAGKPPGPPPPASPTL